MTQSGIPLNFTTHFVFGLAIGAVFFGKPDAIFLLGIGSLIPDLDREYGFFSRESFRRHQIHRALCHNFLFLGLVYLVNPYLGLGAFLHTLLDALTTAKDRGVEWLYPFSRLVKGAVYDSYGKRLELDPNERVYFYQNEPLALSLRAAPDLRPDGPQLPWRRTYGPAVSGRLLDDAIFVGSSGLVILLVALSGLGYGEFVDLTYRGIDPAFVLPLLVGMAGGLINFVAGEVHRRKQLRSGTAPIPDSSYRLLWFVSVAIMVFAMVLGGVMNPQVVLATADRSPYIAMGVLLVAMVSAVMLRTYAKRPLPSAPKDEPTTV